MPELPEVETVVRSLRPLLEGKRIKAVRVLRSSIIKSNPALFLEQTPGRIILNIQRRGKYILCRLSGRLYLVFHLGMSGRLYCTKPGTPPAKHTHLFITLAGNSLELHFEDPRRFGRVVLLHSAELESYTGLQSLGPDPLEISLNHFQKSLQSRKRGIKALLLDQYFLAGMGNIYSDEALFRCSLHPKQLSHSLSMTQSRQLFHAIRHILKKAIAAGGSSIRDYVDGLNRPGQFQLHYFVYGRTNEPCRKKGCKGIIHRISAGGRSAHFCPVCQPFRRA